jgi:hypothetical protein
MFIIYRNTRKFSQNHEEQERFSNLLHTWSTTKVNIWNHAMVISNVKKLTDLRFYNVCDLGFRKSDHDLIELIKTLMNAMVSSYRSLTLAYL